MTLSGPPCPHLAAIAGGFGPHYGWGTAGQADIQATWRCGCRAQNGRRRLQAAWPTRITVERKPHDEGAHGRSTRSPKEEVMFKASRSRSSAIHQPSNAAYAGGAPAGNAESAAASAGRRRCVAPP